MKRTINGLTYNTETATFLASYDNRLPWSDFKYEETDLYRTKNGRYFLAGHGGALSRWAERLEGGNRCQGEGIMPLSEDEAMKWAEEFAPADYGDIFEEIEA